MKSESRGLIVSLMIFFLWGTVVTGPFRYFADAFRSIFLWISESLHVPSFFYGFLVPLLLVAVLLFFLALGTKKNASYTAGICALLSLFYYLFHSILERAFDSVSIAVVIGLALALLFIIFRVDGGSLWLSDAYIFSITVLLFFELVLSPFLLLFPDFREPAGRLWIVESESLGTGIGDLLGLPALLWSGTFFILLMIPVFFLSRGRKKG